MSQYILNREFACRIRQIAMDAWEESKHRRASDGRFGNTEGEHGGGDKTTQANEGGSSTATSPKPTEAEEPKTPEPKKGFGEEWTPRDKSGDKIADDGTIMKNGVALDKTFQDGGTQSKYRLARNKWVKQLLSSDDGTFDLETGKPVEYDSGFQVAFQTTASEKDGGMSDEEYDRIVDDVVKQTGAKPELGCFEVPEISFHFEDRLQAIQMMEKYNQHSIWNWGKFRIVMNKKLDTSTNDVKQGEIAKAGESQSEEK